MYYAVSDTWIKKQNLIKTSTSYLFNLGFFMWTKIIDHKNKNTSQLNLIQNTIWEKNVLKYNKYQYFILIKCVFNPYQTTIDYLW